MKTIHRHQLVLLAVICLLAGGNTGAREMNSMTDMPAGDDQNELAISINVIHESANTLFECPPLNIDPDTMSCVNDGFEFVTLGRIPFDYDKSSVNTEAVQSLDAAAIYLLLNMQNIHRIYIEGHADNKGGDNYNQRLSARRANAVKRYLMNRGIASERLLTSAYGESHPVDEYWTPEGRKNNRNVGLYVVKRRSTTN